MTVPSVNFYNSEVYRTLQIILLCHANYINFDFIYDLKKRDIRDVQFDELDIYNKMPEHICDHERKSVFMS